MNYEILDVFLVEFIKTIFLKWKVFKLERNKIYPERSLAFCLMLGNNSINFKALILCAIFI